jgi:hypothetical protein
MNKMKLWKEELKPGSTYRQKAKQANHYCVFLGALRAKIAKGLYLSQRVAAPEPGSVSHPNL